MAIAEITIPRMWRRIFDAPITVDRGECRVETAIDRDVTLTEFTLWRMPPGSEWREELRAVAVGVRTPNGHWTWLPLATATPRLYASRVDVQLPKPVRIAGGATLGLMLTVRGRKSVSVGGAWGGTTAPDDDGGRVLA